MILVGTPRIRALNRRYLGRAARTDVIAFDLRGRPAVPGAPAVAGEIYVCLDLAVEAARSYGTSVGYEVMLYIVHGMLHLAGEDDGEPVARRRMRRAENRILSELRRDFDLDAFFAPGPRGERARRRAPPTARLSARRE